MKTTPCLEAYDWSLFERVIVLSPHLDDAVLSTAGLLVALGDRISRLVVTIACGNPIPRTNAKKGRVRKGFAPPAERRREDMAAMRELDCDYVHLGFADCIYRRSPTTGNLIYKQARTRFAVSAPEDRAHVEELFLVLRRLCHNMGRVLIVSPLAIGFHVDHAICAQVALQLAPMANILFYEDIPYVFDPNVGAGQADGPLSAMERLGLVPKRRLVLPYEVATKVHLTKKYDSQLAALFPEPSSFEDELTRRTWEGHPAEFYWQAKRFVPKT